MKNIRDIPLAGRVTEIGKKILELGSKKAKHISNINISFPETPKENNKKEEQHGDISMDKGKLKLNKTLMRYIPKTVPASPRDIKLPQIESSFNYTYNALEKSMLERTAYINRLKEIRRSKNEIRQKQKSKVLNI